MMRIKSILLSTIVLTPIPVVMSLLSTQQSSITSPRLFSCSGLSSSKNKNKTVLPTHAASRQQGVEEEEEEVDVCIIGAGISGLSAALTCAKNINSVVKSSSTTDVISKGRNRLNICVIEARDKVGGRVTSDYTKDGFILDKGFAVFVDTYPMSKHIFDYKSLELQKFEPGALIRQQQQGMKKNNKFATVADPIRQPTKLFTALSSPIGTWTDKIRLLPLFYNVKSKSIEELFMEDETDTLSCLRERYKFTNKFINEFFTPFLEGIYFSPLDQQSSRMFHFVFKMFADGSATLPRGGMQAVSDQLAKQAVDHGVEFKMNHVVQKISRNEKSGKFTIHMSSTPDNDRGDDDNYNSTRQDTIHAKRIICATEYVAACQLISTIANHDFLSIPDYARQPQRSAGCIYYSFQGDAPIMEKILILNSRDNDGPINTLCFPSVVNDSYAPKGYNLCCISLTESVVSSYNGRDHELDIAVRTQLADWFEDFRDDIFNVWELKGDVYRIIDGQPSQLGGYFPANKHGGRDCTEFEGLKLPDGLLICGDHMSTATLNGAIESGINAAIIATKSL